MKDYLDFFSHNALTAKFTVLKENCPIGVDGTNMERFLATKDAEFSLITKKIASGTYRFSRYRQKLIVKDAVSPPREVVIPTMRDRLTLACLSEYIKQQSPQTHNNLQLKQIIYSAIDNVRQSHFTHFIKIDIKSFFPSIDHELLELRLNALNFDEKAIKIIMYAIRQRSQKGAIASSKVGIPQGLPISGLLADIFVQDIDNVFDGRDDCRYFRFVDDLLILCHANNYQSLANEIIKAFAVLKLTIHSPEVGGAKSALGPLSDGTEFLGYYISTQRISVRQSSVQKMYNNINKVFLNEFKYAKKRNLKRFYERLNLKITGCVLGDKTYGWMAYFHHINDLTLLSKLDSYVVQQFTRYEVPYKKEKVKRFMRAFYEYKSLERSNYIPKFETSLMIDLEELIAFLNE